MKQHMTILIRENLTVIKFVDLYFQKARISKTTYKSIIWKNYFPVRLRRFHVLQKKKDTCEHPPLRNYILVKFMTFFFYFKSKETRANSHRNHFLTKLVLLDKYETKVLE